MGIRIKNRKDLKKAMKEGLSLEGADLSYARLSKADLSGAHLSKADFSGANLSGANLSEADLSRANLSGANLSYANLFRATLFHADLSRANLSEANFYRANLSGSHLSGTNLCEAHLLGADLYGADLSGADLSGADLDDATIQGSNIEDVFSKEMLVDRYFVQNSKGYIVYKGIGNTYYELPSYWKIEEGSYLEEKCNLDRRESCSYGINFGTLEWINANLKECDSIWECLIEFKYFDKVCMPYATDGKGRCGKLKLIRKVR